MTLTRRFAQKKNGLRDPPPQKIISKNYFFSNSISSTQIVISWWTAGGVRALWVSEYPLWRTRYYALTITCCTHTLLLNITVFNKMYYLHLVIRDIYTFKGSFNVKVMEKCIFFLQEICHSIARPQEVTRKKTPWYLPPRP